MSLVDAHADAIAADLERRKQGLSMMDEGMELKKSLRAYIRQAWHVLKPEDPFVDGWHIGAMCEQLERVTAGETRRLLVTVPPGSMKTWSVSIAWPTWEWTIRPSLRYLTASYGMEIATEMAIHARDLILSDWYQQRYGHVYQLKGDLNLKQSYANNRGGARYVNSPNAKQGGTGKHAHRIIIDDPIDAMSAEATSEAILDQVIRWHDGVLSTRFADPKKGVEIIIMQRLHERDLAGHVIEQEEWTMLCLPERYDPKHPFVYPQDPRKEGELLWPERIGEVEHARRRKNLGGHRAAGQLQQEPAAREGEILKRAFWNYYSEEALAQAEVGNVSELPAFRAILYSWDTSFKEKTSSDPIAGGVWGITRGDRYLLRTVYERASLSRTKTLMLELRSWGLERWPRAAQRILVENKSNGPDIIAQLRREIPGVTTYNPGNLDKTQRAEAAEPDLDSGNVYICGAPKPPYDALGRGVDYDPSLTPAWAQEVIDQCAAFPNARNDDLVDMTAQALNWVRGKGSGTTRFYDPGAQQIPNPAGIPTGVGGRMLG